MDVEQDDRTRLAVPQVMLHYREYAPAADLRCFVRCYWRLTGAGGGIERILPDGRPELVAELGDRFERLHPGGAGDPQASCLFIGQMRRVSVLRPGPVVSVFGVRFKADGAAAFAGPPQQEFAERIVALEDVWGAGARGWEERLRNAATDLERASVTDAFLRSRLRVSEPSARVRYAIGEFARRPDALIGGVASGAGIGMRQFQREFLDHVGLSAKAWIRVVRLQRALEIRRSHGDWNWARISQEAGYYDQAHLAADCREIAGSAPSVRESEETAMERFLCSFS